MAVDAAQLLARVGADTSDAESKIGGMSGRLQGMADDLGRALLKHDLIRLATDSLVGFARTAVDSYAENERLGQSFETLIAKELRQRDASLGMADALAQASPKAQELLRWNTQLAINSPFTEAGVSSAFRTAQAYGFVSDSADKTTITAKRLTQDIVDFVAGSGQTEEAANRVALALGQIQAKGRVAGQEVLQLVNAGIPVDQILARAFNKTTAEIVALREQGAIPADAAIKAIVQSLESDFGGAAQRQAGTLAGLMSSLQDLQRVGARDFLGPAFQAAQPFVQQLVDTLQRPETREEMQRLGQAIGTLAGQTIPALIQAGGDAIRVIESIGTQGEPVFRFLGENATPIIAGLGAAITFNLIPALAAGSVALIESIGAFAIAAAPIAAVGIAIAGVTKAYQDYEAQINRVTDKVLAGSQGWQEARQALDAYNQATDAAQAGAQDQADHLQGLMDAERQAIAEYTAHQVAYREIGRLSGVTQDQLQREQATINIWGQVIRDATRDLNDHVQTYEHLHDTDAIEDIRAQRGAHQELGLQIQQSTEQLQKFQDRLERAGDSGAEAYVRIEESQAQFQRQEADRLSDHQDRLSGIETDARQRRTEAAAQYHERIADLDRGHQDKLADFQRAADSRRTEAMQREHERQEQSAEQLNQKLADIQQRTSDLTDQYEQQRRDRTQSHQDKLVDIQQTGAQRTAEAEQRFLDQRAEAELAYNDRVADLTQQLADLQEQAAERAEDRQRTLTDRLRDLQEQGSDRQQDAQERFDDDRRNKTQDHQDRLTDLQERLGEATTEAQRTAIQRQIEQENERFAKQEQRAREAFERQQHEAAEDLARQIARAQEQAAREEEHAQEQLARQEQRLAEQRAALERDFQEKQNRQQQQYEREQAAREAALAQQVADEEQSYARSRQAAQRKYDHDLALLNDQVAKERANYAEREADVQRHYAQTLADQAAALTQQVADENRAYERQRGDLDRHYQEQRRQQREELARRLDEENKNFTQQEADARASYDRQQKDLREALGKQLAAYTDIQKDMTQISAEEAARRRAVIAAEFGFDPAAAQAEFGRIFAQILGGPAAGTPGSAGGLNIQGDVNLQLPPGTNTENPHEFAREVRSELIKLGQQNKGLSGGVLGGF